MPSNQKVRANRWCKFQRTFSNQKAVRPRVGERRKGTRTKRSETRYIREIIYGQKRAVTYWQITTDPKTMPENSTSFVQTNIKGQLKKILGDLYGLRTWIEYSFRQCKQELGWTDYRFTKFKDIEKWWEIIFCVYTMISFNSPAFLSLKPAQNIKQKEEFFTDFSAHQQWDTGNGWKNVLNNFRLIIQPTILLWLIFPWLDIFPNRYLLLGFHNLIATMNQFQPCYLSG